MTGILAGRGALVAVPAEELGDLGLQRGLHQQLRAEPGDVLQDLRKLLVLSEQLINVAIRTVLPSRRLTSLNCGDGPRARIDGTAQAEDR